MIKTKKAKRDYIQQNMIVRKISLRRSSDVIAG